MSKLTVVVGGQYGSEGKGAIAAYLSRSLSSRDLAVRVAGPNAGHTVYDSNHVRFPLRQVPVAAAVNDSCQLWIAPGSEVDLPVLLGEIDALEAAGHRVKSRLAVSARATVIEQAHKDGEGALGLTDRLGSTGKGIGYARAERILRTARTVGEFEEIQSSDWNGYGNKVLDNGGHVLIEGTQGYGLGLHAEFYPKCTSSDCTAVDFLSMAQVSPWLADTVEVWVVVRPYPIRVAGNSGYLYGETTWEDLSLPEEKTTVTQKVRRVGAWDRALVQNAVEANGGAPTVRLALTMADHLDLSLYGTTDELEISDEVWKFVRQVEAECQAPVELLGTGPETVIDLRHGGWSE